MAIRDDDRLRALQEQRRALVEQEPPFDERERTLLPRLPSFEHQYQRARLSQAAYANGFHWALLTGSALLASYAAYAHFKQTPLLASARNILLPTLCGIALWLQTEKTANDMAMQYRHERLLRGADYALEERQARINPYELL